MKKELYYREAPHKTNYDNMLWWKCIGDENNKRIYFEYNLSHKITFYV